jgi:hypothetical protein
MTVRQPQAHAVKNLGKPRHVVGPLDGIVQVISCLELDSGTQSKSADRLSSKRLRAREIEHRSPEIGVGLAKVYGVGSWASPQVEEMPPLGEIDFLGDPRCKT